MGDLLGSDASLPVLGGIAIKNGRGRSRGPAPTGGADGDGRTAIPIGSVFADQRADANSGLGVRNAGETHLNYGSVLPATTP